MPTGIDLIAAERQRQIDKEGYGSSHDDGHGYGEMARAASCYALPPINRHQMWLVPEGNGWRFATPEDDRDNIRPVPDLWPWTPEDWKPSPYDRLRELAKAGALIAAEMDRIIRRAS